MTTALWGAIDCLEGGEKWGKGHKVKDGVDTHCILGAVGAAKFGNPDVLYVELEDTPEVAALAKVIGEQYYDRRKLNAEYPSVMLKSSVVIMFNDHPNTTYADVERVMQKAAIAEDEVLW